MLCLSGFELYSRWVPLFWLFSLLKAYLSWIKWNILSFSAEIKSAYRQKALKCHPDKVLWNLFILNIIILSAILFICKGTNHYTTSLWMSRFLRQLTFLSKPFRFGHSSMGRGEWMKIAHPKALIKLLFHMLATATPFKS